MRNSQALSTEESKTNENSEVVDSEKNEESESRITQVSEEERLGTFIDCLIKSTWLKLTNEGKIVLSEKDSEQFYPNGLLKQEWSIRDNSEDKSCTRREKSWINLLWPGQNFFQIDDKTMNIYWGRGERNLDLPFMIGKKLIS